MQQPIAIRAQESARAAFIRRTYAHLAGAILAFVALEFFFFQILPLQARDAVVQTLFGSTWSLLILMAAFVGAGWLAQAWAQSDASPGIQYLGLGLYVFLQAIIFIPILLVAAKISDDPAKPNLIATAGVMTLAMFGGLTAVVFITRKDYSFLGPILALASFIALGFIIAAIIFGFTLGLVFSFAMVALASAFILYDTSNVLHHYRTDQHVAAALALFASVAVLFFWILRILIALNGDRGR
jgi:FtsH-binding integral membrane protein